MPKILLYKANRPALHFSPKNSIGSRSTGSHLEISSINNQRTARVFIRFLAYFPGANLSSTSLPSIFWKYSKTFHEKPENIQRLFINNPKMFKNFFACKIVLAANHQRPENIQRLFFNNPKIFKDFFACKIVSAVNRQLYSGNIPRLFGQSTAAINSSNQQHQSTAPINSTNQQQKPAAAINSSNQQRQSTAATGSSNQQQQPAASTQSTTTSVSYNYGS